MDDKSLETLQRHAQEFFVPLADDNASRTDRSPRPGGSQMNHLGVGVRHDDPPLHRLELTLVWQAHGDVGAESTAGIVLERGRCRR